MAIFGKALGEVRKDYGVLKLVGNTSKDHIFHNEELVMDRDGCIENIARRLRVPFTKYSEQVSDLILHLPKEAGGSRECIGFMATETVPRDMPSSFWTHISYLDCVDIDMKSLNSQMVSADICLMDYTDAQVKALTPLLGYVDVLHCTEDNLHALGMNLAGVAEYVKGYLMYRGKDEVQIFGAEGFHKRFPNIQIEALNTVGAGDAFVAEFLNMVALPFADYLMYGKAQFAPTESIIVNRCVSAAITHLREQN